jgi:hypothetical protein
MYLNGFGATMACREPFTELTLTLFSFSFTFRPCYNGGSEHGKTEESKRHLPQKKTHVRVDE